MRVIELTHGQTALVDDADYGHLITGNKWRAFKSENGHTFYAVRTIRKADGRKTSQLMHRFLLRLRSPKRKADHKDNDGLNNQRHNLRRCSQSQNRMNSRKTPGHSSKYKGVCWDKQTDSWIVQLKIKRKAIHIGRFKDEVLAAKAYDKEAKKRFKSFALLNFPQAAHAV